MRRVLGSLALFALVAGCNSNPPIVIMDTGPGSDTPSGADVPRTDTPGTTCPPATVPAPTMPVCASSTLTCLMMATTQAQQMACFAADPAGDACLTCVNQDALNSCTTPGMGTCNDENGLLECCVQDACPTGDMACIGTATGMGGACASQVNGLIMCANTDIMAMRCGINPAVCFMPATGFLPDLRPATRINFTVTRLWSGSFAN